jgi:hypothetical protein
MDNQSPRNVAGWQPRETLRYGLVKGSRMPF